MRIHQLYNSLENCRSTIYTKDFSKSYLTGTSESIQKILGRYQIQVGLKINNCSQQCSIKNYGHDVNWKINHVSSIKYNVKIAVVLIRVKLPSTFIKGILNLLSRYIFKERAHYATKKVSFHIPILLETALS